MDDTMRKNLASQRNKSEKISTTTSPSRGRAAKELDAVDREILAALQADDRLGLVALGKRVGLAASSVNDRIRRLTERGVISGFHARLSPEALGLELLAFVFVGWDDPAAEAPFLASVNASDAVLECHHVTGAWNYLIKVRLANTRALEGFLGTVIKGVRSVQRTETLIALSSPKETAALAVAADGAPEEKRAAQRARRGRR